MQRPFQELAQKLNQRLQDLNIAYCSGCYEGLENQLGHRCLERTSKDIVESFFEEAFASLSRDEIVETAKNYLQGKFVKSAEKHDNVGELPDSTTDKETNQ